MGAFSKLQAFMFATLLAKPFVEWDAYKLGIIDEKGNVIRKPVTREEKLTLDTFDNFVRKIKKILVKYLPDTRLLGFLVSAYLLKSESKSQPDAISEIYSTLTENENDMLYDIVIALQKASTN